MTRYIALQVEPNIEKELINFIRPKIAEGITACVIQNSWNDLISILNDWSVDEK